MIVYRNSSTFAGNPGLSFDMPVPSGVQAGDFMIAHVTYRQGGGSVITPPAGWTVVRNDNSYPDSGGVTGMILTKVASSSEPSTYHFDLQDFRLTSGGIIAYSGVKNVLPIDVSDVSTSEGTTTPTTPSIDTVYAAPWLLWFLAARNNMAADTATSPAGMTLRWRVNSEELPSAGCVSILADQVSSGPGSSGAKAGAISPSGHTVAQVLFLSPADENPNHVPHAHAGPDKATHVGEGTVLDGSGSTEVDPGDTLTYAWTHLSGPNSTAQLNNTAIAAPTYTPAFAGIDTFRLTVTDLATASSSDDVTISTTPPGVSVTFASGLGTSMEVPLPADAAVNDVAFFAIAFHPFAAPPTVAGWSAINFVVNGFSSTDISLWVFAKRLVLSDLGGTVIGLDTDLFGGHWTGHVITVRGLHTSQLFNKTVSAIPIISPNNFSNSVVGASGSATYEYIITAIDAAGETFATHTQTVESAPNTLTSLNYVKLLWQPAVKTSSYKVYGRTSGSHTLLATITTPQDEVPDEFYYIYKDIGTAPGVQTPPTQAPMGWLLDDLQLDGDGVNKRPERLYTTFANGRVLMLAAAQLDSANTNVDVADPSGVSPIKTSVADDGKIVLHSAIQTIASAGDVGTRVFTPTDRGDKWGTIGLTLRPIGGNGTPVANAGFNEIDEVGSTVYLDAAQSIDQDGDLLSYHWTQTAGPTVTLSDANTVAPHFVMPDGDVTFSVNVTDPDGAHDSDTVTISVVTSGFPKVQNSSNEWITSQ